jgi:adenylate cyclase
LRLSPNAHIQRIFAMTLAAYLPQDRRRALARGEDLPDRTTGSALFADVSGFTVLTEQLRHTLGPRGGAEELARRLNAVYTALIAEVELYGGSVVGFAGDAITCWFENERPTTNDQRRTNDSAMRALACGLAMQTAMSQFPELRVKVAVASGPARRFAVGDPEIQRLDALAGATVNRMAAAERLAHQGELVADEATITALGAAVTVVEWRNGFGVVVRCEAASGVKPVAAPPLLEPEPETLRSWLLRPVYEREQTQQAAFLTEFRPCAALFVHFEGIDYDDDEALGQLDAFVRQVQTLAARYEGHLLSLIIGDKGSYLYLNFGALIAHEDNGRRALKTALELAEVADLPLQMGVAQGVMRVGAYGGATRQTYAALGDDVNLAARLMATAALGEILLSDAAQKSAADEFLFEPRPSLPLKGKAEPLPVFALTGRRQQRAIRLQEPTYRLPMVGRQAALRQIEDRLDLAAAGQGQIVGIIAEAGLGKSRLAAEVVRLARQKGFVGYGGACQSDAISTAYHVWKSVWQPFFNVDPEASLPKLTSKLADKIKKLAPSRIGAMPLLNRLLGVNIPENDFARTLDPKTWQSALHALLEDCLKAAAQQVATLIVLEDVHWIDALSHDLLEQLARATAGLPVCFVLVYRPPKLARLAAPRLEGLPQFTRIELNPLTAVEGEQVIRAKLAQLYPSRGGALSAGLVETLMARSQGNPFYLEELLNYLRDRGLDPADMEQIELPDSLHTLILSRIDRLRETEKNILRAASVIGRLFRADWLIGYYPELGPLPQVKESLDQLHRLEMTPLESAEPELVYLFKHVVTHEATYESLPLATRAELHERLAAYLERVYAEAPPLETLAFHYSRSDNRPKQIVYLQLAGESSQKNFANDAALDFYGDLLPLLDDDREKLSIHLRRGEVLELMGAWSEAENDYRAALALAHDNAAQKARAQLALGRLNRQRGEYETAHGWLSQAREIQLAAHNSAGLVETGIELGMVLWHQSAYADAAERFSEELARAQAMGDKASAALALNNLGNVALFQADYAAAQRMYENSLALRRELADKQGIAGSLNNLGLAVMQQGDYVAARPLYEESLSLAREMGSKWSVAKTLHSLGVLHSAQGDYAAARTMYEESLSLQREVGDKQGVSNSLNNLGLMAGNQGDYATARALHEESLSLKREMGDKRGVSNSLNNLGETALAQAAYGVAQRLLAESLTLKQEMGDKWSIAHSLNNLGVIALAQGDFEAARALFDENLSLYRKVGNKRGMATALLGLGRVALAENKPEAAEYILNSLRLRVETGERLRQIASLVGMAGLALHQDNARQAARWLGATAAALSALGAALEPAVIGFHTQTLAAVKERLGADAFQQAWDEGAQWTLAEATAYALDLPAAAAAS